MQAKRFIAADMRRALDMVRDELGEDAMILSTQRTTKGVELVVTLDAVPTDTDLNASHVDNTHDQTNIRHQVIASAAEKYSLAKDEEPVGTFSGKTKQQLADEMETARQRMLASRKAGSITLQEWANGTTLKSTPEQAPTLSKQPTASEVQLTNTLSHHQAVAEPVVEPEKSEDIRRLHDEINDMRSLLEGQLAQMAAMQKQQCQPQATEKESLQPKRQLGTKAAVAAVTPMPQTSNIVSVAKQMRQHLDDLGLHKACNDQLIASLNLTDKPELLNTDLLLQETLNHLTHSIPSTQADPVAAGGVYAFLGITGVGKTTTIAKLAARYVMQHGSQDVVLLTTDTYRIASSHQLESLANILNVTVKVVEDLEQLPALVEEARERALVLIDTPGMSYSDPLLKSHLQALRKCKAITNILVLSANSQYQVMKAAIHSYREAKLDYCVMSKLDECAHLGDAISVLVDHNLPLAYVTDGQSVPEDIDIVESSQLVARAQMLSHQTQADGMHISSFSYPSF